MGRDRSFASLALWAQTRAARSGQAVYTYRFDHAYPATPAGKRHGVFHTSELPYVTGVLNAKGRVFSAQDHAVSAAMRERWLTFIKTGDPSVPGQAWQRAGAEPVVMALGDAIGPQPAVSNPERYALFRDFVALWRLVVAVLNRRRRRFEAAPAPA